MLLLSGCASIDKQSSQSSSSSKKIQTTGQADNSMYAGVIENGRYQVSKTRGLTVKNSNNTFDVKSLETGLSDLSKTNFSTEKYTFQEGQILSVSDVQNWLARQSDSNPKGLNPKDNGQTDAKKRNPIYIQQILEQDYLDQDHKLAGMSIGLGVNQIDYYQKEKYGAVYKTTISKEQMLSEGKAAADKVVKRLRQKSEVANQKIVVGLYAQAPKDSLVGGTYFAYGISKSGDKIDEWHNLNLQNQVFPLVDGQKAINSSDVEAFNNFKTQTQTFFPNLAGITAQARYQDDVLAGMKINITTQFYSQSEIASFTQYITTSANKYLPKNISLEIKIKSVDDMQAYISREADQKDYNMQVFGSY